MTKNQKYSDIITNVENHILIIRGEKVMLDSDLAELYGVSTKRLNEQVRRNRARFPKHFMFRITATEAQSLRSQFATSNSGRGGRRYEPYVFTEHGAVMLATVLNSKTAIEASVKIVEAFIRLRSILAAHKELARKIEQLSKTTDIRFKIVFDLIKKHLPPHRKTGSIGYRTNDSR